MKIIYPSEFMSEARAFPGTVFACEPPAPSNPNDCPNCGGRGYLYVQVKQSKAFNSPPGGTKPVAYLNDGWYQVETRGAPCPVCNGDAKYRHLLENCGLSGRDLDVTLTNFKPLPGKAESRALIGNLLGMNLHPQGFVTFHGSYGVGKTMLLYALVNGFRAVGLLAYYTTMADLLATVRDQFDDGGRAAEALLLQYRHLKVLCLDEVDRVNLTPWARETIFRLLDGRYKQQAGVLTVMATNTNPASMSGDWGYLASRMTAGEVVEVGGVDVRPLT